MSLGRRLSRLEHGVNRDEVEEERKQKGERADALHVAECSNRDSRREGLEPFFEITENGEVFSAYDGRPVTRGYQAHCEGLYWQYLAWGVRDLIHDEDAQEFCTQGGELALSRTYMHLRRLVRRG